MMAVMVRANGKSQTKEWESQAIAIIGRITVARAAIAIAVTIPIATRRVGIPVRGIIIVIVVAMVSVMAISIVAVTPMMTMTIVSMVIPFLVADQFD